MLKSYYKVLITFALFMLTVGATSFFVKSVGLDGHSKCSNAAASYLVWTAILSFVGVIVQFYLLYRKDDLIEMGIESEALIRLGMSVDERRLRAILSIEAASIVIIITNISYLIFDVFQLKCVI